MRKITLKAIKYQDLENGMKICVGDCIFADTKEQAGTRQGWAGSWTVTNAKGEVKEFENEKKIREWLGQE